MTTITESRVDRQYSPKRCSQCGATIEGTTCQNCGTKYVVTQISKTVRTDGNGKVEQLMSFGDTKIAIEKILFKIETELPKRHTYVKRQINSESLAAKKNENKDRDTRFLRSVRLLTAIVALAGLTSSLALPAVDLSTEEFYNPIFFAMLTIGFLSVMATVATFHDSDFILEQVYYRGQKNNQHFNQDQQAEVQRRAYEIEASHLQSWDVESLYQYWAAFADEIAILEPEIATKIAVIFKTKIGTLLDLGHGNGIEELLNWCEQQMLEASVQPDETV